MTTKRDLVRLAYEELGVPAYNGGGVPGSEGLRTATAKTIIDLAYGEAGQSPLIDGPSPEEYVYAQTQLSAMLAEWQTAKGLALGYIPVGLTQQCGIADGAARPIAMSLAIRLSVLIGRQISDDTRQAATDGLASLLAYYNSSIYRRLDALMQEWYAAYGIDLGWNFTDAPSGDDVVSVPPGAEQVVATSLAMRLAPTLGKSVSAETRKAQAVGFSSLRTAYMQVPTMQLARNTVAGAGNRYRWSPFFNPAQDVVVENNGFPTYEDGNGVIQ